MSRHEEAVRARTVAVDVVRLTPLQDGAPDHPWAAVFTPTGPLALTIAALYPQPCFTAGPCVRNPTGPLRLAAAFTTSPHQQDLSHVQAMNLRLHQHAPAGMAVETWTAEHPTPPGRPLRWLYNLLPRWTWAPVEDWPLQERPHTLVHTMGRVTPNPGHTWPTPRPCPPPAGEPVAAYHCLTAVTETPPPPAG